MAVVHFLVIAILPLLVASRNLLAPTRISAELQVLEECKDVRNNACTFLGPIVRARGRNSYAFSGTFNISRSAHSISEIWLNFTRCRDMVSSNTCEHFHTWRLDHNPCRVWTDPEAPWATFVKGFSSHYQCPTKEGTYEMKNVTLDASGLTKLNLPLEGAVWQCRVLHFQPKGVLHYCMDSTWLFHRVRA